MKDEIKSQYKKKLIETMFVFDKFCKDNNIKYFATGGTAIGAIRHKGLIPWDDDIDVCMIREDYDKFLKLNSKLSNTQYHIASLDDNGYYLPYAKFCDYSTTLWEEERYPHVIGIFIDIFPLDHVSHDIEKNKSFQRKYMRVCELMFRSSRDCFCRSQINGLLHGSFKVKLSWFFDLCIHPLHFMFKKHFLKLYDQMRHGEGKYLLNHYTDYRVEKELFPEEWFSSQERVPFEDIEIMLPNGWDNYLSQLFGDYMKLPPEEKRVSGHVSHYLNLEHRLTISEIRKLSI